MANVVTDNLDIWSSAENAKRSGRGRGAGKQSPYGIKKLRELILTLAMRGKLVPQDPSSEDASKLLERIAAEKMRLAELGIIKKKDSLANIPKNEIPFELPSGWAWAKLGDLMEMYNGRAFKSTEWSSTGLPIVRIQNLNDETAGFNYFEGVVETQNLIDNGTFLISWSGTPGTSFGAFIWKRGKAALNQHINKCVLYDSELNLNFLKLAINSRLEHLISKAQGGVGLKHVTRGTLDNTILGVPPLAEQECIVSKVDELMALCDQLEKQQGEQGEAHERLVKTILDVLTGSPDSQQFVQNWKRLSASFDVVFDTPESIDKLKQTILQLAMQGKFELQNPNDESASELLNKIRNEKSKLVGEGKIKASKNSSEIRDEEKIFDLPNNWEWATLQDLAELITDGDHNPPKRAPSGIPHLTAKHIKNWRINLEDCTFLSEADFEKTSARYKPMAGDLIVTCVGTVGETAIVPEGLVFSADRNLAALRFSVKRGLPEYVQIALNAPSVALKIKSASGATAQPHIYLGDLRKQVIPVPPLQEQHRIVAKVVELLRLCDTLLVKLNAAQSTQIQLADAVVENAIV